MHRNAGPKPGLNEHEARQQQGEKGRGEPTARVHEQPPCPHMLPPYPTAALLRRKGEFGPGIAIPYAAARSGHVLGSELRKPLRESNSSATAAKFDRALDALLQDQGMDEVRLRAWVAANDG